MLSDEVMIRVDLRYISNAGRAGQTIERIKSHASTYWALPHSNFLVAEALTSECLAKECVAIVASDGNAISGFGSGPTDWIDDAIRLSLFALGSSLRLPSH